MDVRAPTPSNPPISLPSPELSREKQPGCSTVQPQRRTANYKPNEWDYTYLQTLNRQYTEEGYESLALELKEEVRRFLDDGLDIWDQLQLVNAIDRLGLNYCFEEEIKQVLDAIFGDRQRFHKVAGENGLHATTTCFRLLRQHGYMVCPDIFDNFIDHENGCFKESLSYDIKGLWSLHHASYLGFDGEMTLDAARAFAHKHLKEFAESRLEEDREQMVQMLELPVYWRMPRLEARNQIELYEKEEGMNSTLLRLAKLNYNMVQSINYKELMKVTSWWTRLGIAKDLRFSRERILECFFGATGIISNPLHGYCREGLAKIGTLLVIIDDVYDIYGSLDELQLFTHMVDRWEVKGTEKLPTYLKLCFTALNDTVNEMAYEVKRFTGWEIQSYLKKAWTDLCKAFLVEARWHNNRYMPTLEEYLSNGWMSVSGPLILFHAYLLSRHELTEEALKCLESYPNIVRISSTIFRLCNDLATSVAEQERGDAPTSIQCYMNESGASEAASREHISCLINATWKQLNRERATNCSSFPQTFVDASMNLARMAHCLYQRGDGFSVPTEEIKGHIMSMLLKPIT